jgi:hypothetical protein
VGKRKGKGVFVKNAPERYIMIAADGSTSSYHGGSSTRHTVRVLLAIERRLLRREKQSIRTEYQYQYQYVCE